MSPINGFLGPRGRKATYFAVAILGLIVGTLQVILAVYDMLDVKWFLALTGVYGYLGGAFGLVAGNNVTGMEVTEPVAPPEAVETDLDPDAAGAADMALVNDEYPVEQPVEVDETPVPEGYEPRH